MYSDIDIDKEKLYAWLKKEITELRNRRDEQTEEVDFNFYDGEMHILIVLEDRINRDIFDKTLPEKNEDGNKELKKKQKKYTYDFCPSCGRLIKKGEQK